MESRICAAIGRTLSAVAPGGPNIAPRNGIMSTTISRPTASGWRAASMIPIEPPIECPTTAGRSRSASRMYRAISSATGAATGPSAFAPGANPANPFTCTRWTRYRSSSAPAASAQRSRCAARPGTRITSGPVPRVTTSMRSETNAAGARAVSRGGAGAHAASANAALVANRSDWRM